MASPKHFLKLSRTINGCPAIGEAGSREVVDFVGRLTVQRALAILSADDLPRRRLDCLLLLASGCTPEMVSGQIGLGMPEIICLRDAALGFGIAHAILFGGASPALGV